MRNRRLLYGSIVCIALLATGCKKVDMGELSFIVDGVKYEVINDNEVQIVHSDSYEGNFYISGTVEYNHSGKAYYVVKIADGAFRNTGITSIFVPSSIKSFGSNIFDGCYRLESVYWSASKVPAYAFGSSDPNSRTSNIKRVKLFNDVTEVGDYAFAGLEGLDENGIELPNTLKRIGAGAFAYCSPVPVNGVYGAAIKEVIFDNPDLEVGSMAFYQSDIGKLTLKQYHTFDCNTIRGSHDSKRYGIFLYEYIDTIDFQLTTPNPNLSSSQWDLLFGEMHANNTIYWYFINGPHYKGGKLPVFISHYSYPPYLYNNPFLNCVDLNVPTGSSSSYSNNAWWKNFNIYEKDINPVL